MSKLDDAAWHQNGDSFPEGVPEENAATHIGCFVAWAIGRDLWGRFLPAKAGPAIEAVAQGRLSGRSFVLQECDGKLLGEMLNEEGAAFAEKYYPTYIKDYQQVLAKGLSSDYLVDDNDANQHRIAAVLDQRFAHWKRGPWWKFW
jgi:hypothetical protein